MCALFLLAEAARSQRKSIPCFDVNATPWADSVFASLSLDEKIGQLFMVAAWSDPKKAGANSANIETLISKYAIGGICFFQGGPVRQATLTNKYQALSKVPLLIGMDAEWGLGMRLDSTISFQRQMTLGALADEKYVYEMGREIAREMKRLGVHVSFSPVVDVNNNPLNPVISNRSFGEQTELVTRYSLAYMKGLQDGGIIATAKHFPGHGDTETDSHKALPVLNHSAERFENLELKPYQTLMNQGLGAVMVAHLYIPALDNTPNLPATLSKKIVNGLLRDKMNFNGLVFTDAMNMQGVTKYFEPGKADVMALAAGNDIVLYPENVALAVEQIKQAIKNGTLSEADINAKVKRILRAKEWAGLSTRNQISIDGLVADLNSEQAQALNRRMVEESITVLRNNCDLIPVNPGAYRKIAVVSIGTGADNAFTRTIKRYMPCTLFSMDKNPDFKSSMVWLDSLSRYDLVIAALLNTSNKASVNFGVSNESARILNAVGANTNVILAMMANPYALNTLKDIQNVEGLLIAYQDNELTGAACAEIIAGAIGSNGVLPVSAGGRFKSGSGLSTASYPLLRWVDTYYAGLGAVVQPAAPMIAGNPAGEYEEDMMATAAVSSAGYETNFFARIDSIARSGIKRGAYPGCRVLLARNGQVLYDKAYGTTDWTNNQPVTEETMYDLASITKVAASTLAAMRLVDEGKLDINASLGSYLTFPNGNAYAQVRIKDMLSHTAGFTAWIPFYQSTLLNGQPDERIYSRAQRPGFSLQVAENLYIIDTYRDSIFQRIISTPLTPGQGYKYSDLGYYFMQRIIEQLTGSTLDRYVDSVFYRPMGLQSMMYNPALKGRAALVAPTEDDQTFRKQMLRGYVHDQGAAMMGGVAGHAGLFSNARDLCALMQMLLNNGVYGPHRYLSAETIALFNTCHFAGNRRGLGFDKPALTPNTGSTCAEASKQSFGHTGFTGTMCWADPANGSVFIFLSNRVCPDAENKKLQDLNIRTSIQKEMYRLYATRK